RPASGSITTPTDRAPGAQTRNRVPTSVGHAPTGGGRRSGTGWVTGESVPVGTARHYPCGCPGRTGRPGSGGLPGEVGAVGTVGAGQLARADPLAGERGLDLDEPAHVAGVHVVAVTAVARVAAGRPVVGPVRLEGQDR